MNNYLPSFALAASARAAKAAASLTAKSANILRLTSISANCKLWITRINAAARLNGLSYSQLMHGLKLAEIEVNRKMLADLAVNDAAAFTALADAAKAKLGK